MTAVLGTTATVQGAAALPTSIANSSFNDDFLLAEDLALKTLLSGFNVSDNNEQVRPIPVWYSQPDQEIRKMTYPSVTLDLLDVQEYTAQVHGGYGTIKTQADVPVGCINNDDYLLEGLAFDDTQYAVGPVYGLSPMLLTYQVTSWARQPRHDRAILAQFNIGPLHPRFAQIQVDSTLRRLIVLNCVKRDTTVEDKRMFRNVWTIQIPSEIFYDPITLTRRAESVMINRGSTTPPADFSGPAAYPGLT